MRKNCIRAPLCWQPLKQITEVSFRKRQQIIVTAVKVSTPSHQQQLDSPSLGGNTSQSTLSVLFCHHFDKKRANLGDLIEFKAMTSLGKAFGYFSTQEIIDLALLTGREVDWGKKEEANVQYDQYMLLFTF